MANFISVSAESKSNKVRRSAVQLGQVFMTEDGKVFAHTGTRTVPPSEGTIRYQSIRLDNTKAKDGKSHRGVEASSAKGDSIVVIVGTYELKATLLADFANLKAKVS